MLSRFFRQLPRQPWRINNLYRNFMQPERMFSSRLHFLNDRTLNNRKGHLTLPQINQANFTTVHRHIEQEIKFSEPNAEFEAIWFETLKTDHYAALRCLENCILGNENKFKQWAAGKLNEYAIANIEDITAVCKRILQKANISDSVDIALDTLSKIAFAKQETTMPIYLELCELEPKSKYNNWQAIEFLAQTQGPIDDAAIQAMLNYLLEDNQETWVYKLKIINRLSEFVAHPLAIQFFLGFKSCLDSGYTSLQEDTVRALGKFAIWYPRHSLNLLADAYADFEIDAKLCVHIALAEIQQQNKDILKDNLPQNTRKKLTEDLDNVIDSSIKKLKKLMETRTFTVEKYFLDWQIEDTLKLLIKLSKLHAPEVILKHVENHLQELKHVPDNYFEITSKETLVILVSHLHDDCSRLLNKSIKVVKDADPQLYAKLQLAIQTKIPIPNYLEEVYENVKTQEKIVVDRIMSAV